MPIYSPYAMGAIPGVFRRQGPIRMPTPPPVPEAARPAPLPPLVSTPPLSSDADVITGEGITYPSAISGAPGVRGTYDIPRISPQEVAAVAGLRAQAPVSGGLGGFQDVGPAGPTGYFGKEYEREFGPERIAEQTRVGDIRKAILGQHPAVQVQAETAARQRAYPQEAEARGRAADAASRIEAARLGATGQRYGALGTSMAGALRGIMANMPRIQGESNADYASRVTQMLNIYNQIAAGGIFPEDEYEDEDEGY